MYRTVPSLEWPEVYRAVLRGREPAESLPTQLRRRLFMEMLADGRTVAEVATWTRTTEYTVLRLVGDS